MKNETLALRKQVLEKYSSIATGNLESEDCGCAPSCCERDGKTGSTSLGYSDDQLASLPKNTDLGLGCGNPLGLELINEGETVLDLGSGAGIDCFLAAAQVGGSGRVIGVDMSPQMIDLARKNAEKVKLNQVEFRLGEIEHLPVSDESVHTIISNCVINLSPEKRLVFREAFRALRPGGKLAVSDIIAIKELPEGIKNNPNYYSGCMGGAETKKTLLLLLNDAGFERVSIEPVEESTSMISEWDSEDLVHNALISANIIAYKPEN